ncbi:MAG: hypothetical protein J3K34DRAFT_525634 [Monoraphidium minutum]|nr:MAG: hypothetical protein J3K34DRAFT_525634 [Monoraphidium minutum]
MLAHRSSRAGRIGAPCHRSDATVQSVRCRSTVESYTQTLLAAERDGDVMRVMEVVTEARVLKLQLPAEATEASIRTFAAGGQWQRAVEMLEALMAGGGGGAQAGGDTAAAVFRALADGQQAERALQLLEVMEQGGRPVTSPVRNLVVRTCAAGGRLDRALELLEGMAEAALRSASSGECSGGDDADVVSIDGVTFSAVASECLKQGLTAQAEEVLDWRDYL